MPVNPAGYVLHVCGGRFIQGCRADLAAVAIVFCVVIEILVIGNDLDQRQGRHLLPVKIGGTGNLATHNGLFHNHRRAFREGVIHGLGQFLPALHLGDAKTRTAIGRLHKNGIAQFLRNLLHKSIHVISPADKGIGSQVHAFKIPQVAFAGIFVKSGGGHEGGAAAERDAEHLEITLQQAVLAGLSVLDDVGKIEFDLLAQDVDGKIGLVHFGTGSFGQRNMHGVPFAIGYQLPFSETGENLIDIIGILVDAGCDKFTSAARNLPLGGIAAIYHCDNFVLGHDLFEIILFRMG